VSGHDAGGILNQRGGNALVENTTITHNIADGAGGIFNQSGSLVVRNSAIIFNRRYVGQWWGNRKLGICRIVNSTIAKHSTGNAGREVSNSGQLSITKQHGSGERSSFWSRWRYRE